MAKHSNTTEETIPNMYDWKGCKFHQEITLKVHFFNHPSDRKPNSDMIFEFQSNITPPSNNDLIAFEDDLYDMIGNTKFNSNTNKFQLILKYDLDKIPPSDKMLVFINKTTNLIKMDSNYYRTLLYNISKTYKKTDQDIKKKTDREAKKLSEKLDLYEKMDCYTNRQSFIKLKDHKFNLKSN